MAAQTDFRPQLHGFDFDNHWDTDDNYRNFIRQKVHDALPIAAKAIATNPAIGAALLAAMGAAYGIGEAFAPGLFDLIAIPIIINQIINAVNDKIDNGLPDNYGACGGMSFTPLDYYYKQWVIPKGIFPKGADSNHVPFIVPPLDLPNAKVLRDYIYQRFEDTWDSGGVLNKMLEWYVILKTIPSQFGGGGQEVQTRCESEWVTLAGLLDQGRPQPIALLFDTWNIFDNHQLVAYGYGGDPAVGPAFINIYDNNHPNRELLIAFDFTQSEMQGRITDTAGNTLMTTDSSGRPVPEYEALKGFFCTSYTPQTPPLSWGVQQGLTVLPAACQSAREGFNLTATAGNAFTFFMKPSQDTRVTPVASDPLSMQVVPSSYQSLPGEDAFAATPSLFAGTESYTYPGDYIVLAKAYVQVWNPISKAVASDQFMQPLARLLNLPALNEQASPSVHVQVLARLQIVAVNRSGGSCYFPFVEGSTVSLQLKSQPFPGAHVSYSWQASSALTGNSNNEQLEVFELPPAGNGLVVSVRVTNLDTGCIASGNATFTTYSGAMAGRFAALCELAHIVSHYMQPGLVNPLGPDNPEFSRFVERNLRLIRRDAEQVLKLTSELEKLPGDHVFL